MFTQVIDAERSAHAASKKTQKRRKEKKKTTTTAAAANEKYRSRRPTEFIILYTTGTELYVRVSTRSQCVRAQFFLIILPLLPLRLLHRHFSLFRFAVFYQLTFVCLHTIQRSNIITFIIFHRERHGTLRLHAAYSYYVQCDDVFYSFYLIILYFFQNWLPAMIGSGACFHWLLLNQFDMHKSVACNVHAAYQQLLFAPIGTNHWSWFSLDKRTTLHFTWVEISRRMHTTLWRTTFQCSSFQMFHHTDLCIEGFTDQSSFVSRFSRV